MDERPKAQMARFGRHGPRHRHCRRGQRRADGGEGLQSDDSGARGRATPRLVSLEKEARAEGRGVWQGTVERIVRIPGPTPLMKRRMGLSVHARPRAEGVDHRPLRRGSDLALLPGILAGVYPRYLARLDPGARRPFGDRPSPISAASCRSPVSRRTSSRRSLTGGSRGG